jgi:hypothetical protein
MAVVPILPLRGTQWWSRQARCLANFYESLDPPGSGHEPLLPMSGKWGMLPKMERRGAESCAGSQTYQRGRLGSAARHAPSQRGEVLA